MTAPAWTYAGYANIGETTHVFFSDTRKMWADRHPTRPMCSVPTGRKRWEADPDPTKISQRVINKYGLPITGHG